MVYKFFFDKNTSDGAIKSVPNQYLVDEHHKPIRKFKKIKVCSGFKVSYFGSNNSKNHSEHFRDSKKQE